jgi:hypothetical protein
VGELVLQAVDQFPDLFRELERQQKLEDSLLDSWGISITTLEEVFLTLAQEGRTAAEGEAPDQQQGSNTGPAASVGTQLGERVHMGACEKFCEHTLSLMRKRYKITAREPINWMLIVVVPVIFILVSLLSTVEAEASLIGLSVAQVAVVAVLYGFGTDVSSFELNAGQFNSPLYLPYIGSAWPTDAASLSTISSSPTTLVPVSVSASDVTNGQFSCLDYATKMSSYQVNAHSYGISIHEGGWAGRRLKGGKMILGESL